MGLRDLAIGVRAAGGVRGVRGGPARDWCRRAVATHRVAAWVMASAALYASATLVASTRQRDALSPAGLTIATLVYVSFAVIAIVRWPPWLLAGVPTLGAVASMAAGTPDLLVGPALVVGTFVVSLRSERTPAIAGTGAVIGVLLAGHLVFRPAREDRVVGCGGSAVDGGGGRRRTGGAGQASARGHARGAGQTR